MAIVIKELIIKGKVVNQLPNARLSEQDLAAYLDEVREEIVQRCIEQLRDEIEQELLMD